MKIFLLLALGFALSNKLSAQVSSQPANVNQLMTPIVSPDGDMDEEIIENQLVKPGDMVPALMRKEEAAPDSTNHISDMNTPEEPNPRK